MQHKTEEFPRTLSEHLNWLKIKHYFFLSKTSETEKEKYHKFRKNTLLLGFGWYCN